jgi:hypothetical protein
MNLRFCSLGMLALTLLAGGCKQDQGPVEVPVDQASAGVKSSFSGANADLKQTADAAAQEMQQGNYVQSFEKLEELSVSTELTPEQRQRLGESQAAVLKKLNEAATKGDAEAAKALEVHRSRK